MTKKEEGRSVDAKAKLPEIDAADCTIIEGTVEEVPTLSAPITRNGIYEKVLASYLGSIDRDNPPSPAQLEAELLELIKLEIDLANATRSKDERISKPQSLPPAVIADVVLFMHHIVRIAFAGGSSRSYDLALYMSGGPQKGIYIDDEAVIRSLICQYNYDISDRDIKAVLNRLEAGAPIVRRCDDERLMAVNNGILNYETKQLMDFTPELVFTQKSPVDYNPNATVCPVIHNDADGTDWDIESQVAGLFDDDGLTNVMWQVIGAVIRPNVHWDRSVWLYSESGSNGKGTLCTLMENLCGADAYASMSLADFSDEFKLESLPRISAIITHENSVNKYIDDVAALKAVVTNDAVQINRKYKSVITVEFRGLMVQCVNDMPRVRDKSESWYRRLLIVPFAKSFTGHERKYIKSDYMHRKDVLEYVLNRVVNMPDYYEFNVPEPCEIILDEYRAHNDPVRDFWNTVCLPDVFGNGGLVWTFVPFPFLYELYVAWFRMYMPSGTPMNQGPFVKDLKSIVASSDLWEVCPGPVPVRGQLSVPEPLITAYNLTNWMGNPRSTDASKRSIPGKKASSYRGIRRKASGGNDGDD